MSLFLKLFENHTQYETYTASTEFITPNISLCTTEGDVHYNPYVEPIETRLVAKFNVTDTNSPIQLCNSSAVSQFSAIEIDGAVQQSVVSAYTFSTTGEHTVKYTLTDPTSIGDYAFGHCYSLTSVNIPNNVTSIGNEAFYYCSSLTSINIPDNVTSIGYNAFGRCSSLTSIDIPSGVTSIGSATFSLCSNLTSCTIGSGVTSIGDIAFSNCGGLTSIDIPSGVTSIGENAFHSCSKLTNITSNATTAPTIQSNTFRDVKTGGTLRVPIGSSGYDTWMQNANYYLGLYNWTKVEQ